MLDAFIAKLNAILDDVTQPIELRTEALRQLREIYSPTVIVQRQPDWLALTQMLPKPPPASTQPPQKPVRKYCEYCGKLKGRQLDGCHCNLQRGLIPQI